jgi:hypothetical protein
MIKKFFRISVIIIFFIIAQTAAQKISPKNYLDEKSRFFTSSDGFNSKAFTGDSILTVEGVWAWGPCLGVDVIDDFVVMGNGRIIQLLNLSDPSNPQIINQVFTDYLIKDIKVKDNLIFALSGNALLIYNFVNQDQIEFVSSLVVGLSSEEINLGDSLAFVVDVTGFIVIVDIRDISNPAILQITGMGYEHPSFLVSENNIIYSSNYEYWGIFIFDITNLDSIEINLLNVNGFAESALIIDTLMYVGVYGAQNKIVVYDISDLRNPVEVSSAPLPFQDINLFEIIGGIVASGNYLYVGSFYSGVVSIDISDPINPIVLDNVYRPSNSIRSTFSITVLNNSICAANATGLWIVDNSNPNDLREETFFSTSDACMAIEIKDNYAFVATGYTGLWILDISDLKNIKPVSNTLLEGFSLDIIVEDSTVFIMNFDMTTGDTNRGLWIVDISDITNPQIINHHLGITPRSLDTHHFSSIAYNNNILVLTSSAYPTSDSTLEIIDVSDLNNPQTLSVFRSQYWAYFACVLDTLIIVAAADSGIRIINYKDIYNPVEISKIDLCALGLVVNKNKVYALSYSVDIIDITNPFLPLLQGTVFTHSGSGSVRGEIVKNLLYWAEGDLGVVDVTEPYTPFYFTSFTSSLYARDVSIQSNSIGLADSYNGIIFLKYDDPTKVSEDLNQTIMPGMIEANIYPNPFNQSTILQIESEASQYIKVELYNLLGEKVGEIFNVKINSGENKISFESENLPSGIYFFLIQSEKNIEIIKGIILK